MTKRKSARGDKVMNVVVNDPDDRKDVLKTIGGSQSDHWNNLLGNQAVQSFWTGNSETETHRQQISATAAALASIGPRDELEGMMAAQLIAPTTPRWSAIAAPCTSSRPSWGGTRT